jgi:glycosyltransferase involved in cell wall biosynthesis
MRLALAIPCYNEARNLPAVVECCRPLAAAGHHIVLVDNGSSDDTPKVMRQLLKDIRGFSTIRVPVNQGYGHGICQGLEAAAATGAEVLGWTHADQQTDPQDALRGMELFAGRDPERVFVKGRREGRPLRDSAFTMGMSLLELALFRAWLPDINAQPTMFGRGFLARWGTPPADFSLDLHAFWMAHAQGLEIRRFPVRFGPRLYGTSHWNDGLRGRWKFIRRTIAYSMALKSQQKGMS